LRLRFAIFPSSSAGPSSETGGDREGRPFDAVEMELGALWADLAPETAPR
jgi:hypothetical protein